MTRKQLIESLSKAAEPVYGEREAVAIARLVAEKLYGLSRADIALEPDAELPDSLLPAPLLEQIIPELAASRPVQYVLGTADFYGLELAVGEGVLIPRPETEELVSWIADDVRKNCFSRKTRILDIGTGSGAIAIALAKSLPEAQVTAVDISPEALRYARLNNEKHSAGVAFREADILEEGLDLGRCDIIVSNPPYIPASECARMADNVTEYEPATALFVPDGDPLVFYRAIARFARRSLSPDGALYFEIHENAADAMAELLAAEGFRAIEIRNDINSKPRMVKCSVEECKQ